MRLYLEQLLLLLILVGEELEPELAQCLQQTILKLTPVAFLPIYDDPMQDLVDF
ncbi:hypothetical protein D3C83_298990 [compost metagenome]